MIWRTSHMPTINCDFSLVYYVGRAWLSIRRWNYKKDADQFMIALHTKQFSLALFSIFKIKGESCRPYTTQAESRVHTSTSNDGHCTDVRCCQSKSIALPCKKEPNDMLWLRSKLGVILAFFMVHVNTPSRPLLILCGRQNNRLYYRH